MSYFEHHGSGLHRLVYVSRSMLPASPDTQAQIADIVAKAAAKNRALAVTGALLAYNGWFVQVLEGSHDTLKPLYERICADPRHGEVILKVVEAAPARLFSRWGMKQGRVPADGVGLDVASTKAADLLQLLKMTALTTLKRAA